MKTLTPNELINKLNRENVWNTQGQKFYEARVGRKAMAEKAQDKLNTVLVQENKLRENMNLERTNFKKKVR